MNWYDRLLRRSKDVIPNPRDSKRRREKFETAQLNVLRTLQGLVFMLAILILAMVS